MIRHPSLSVTLEQDGPDYLARCPELGIECRGETAEDAHANLLDTVDLFLEHADPYEIQDRLRRHGGRWLGS